MKEQNKKIKIGITGQSGFMGTHLYNYLGLKESIVRIPFSDEFFNDTNKLDDFVQSCDIVVHLAAMNRHGDPQVIYDTNIKLVVDLIKACERTGSNPHIIFSSSSQENRDNLYGKSKKDGRRLFEKWANEKRVKAEIKSEARKAWVVNGLIGTAETAKRVTVTSLKSIVKYPAFTALKTLAFFVGKSDKVQLGKMVQEDWEHVTQPIRDTFKEAKDTSKKAKASVTEAEVKRKAEKITDIRKRVQMVKALKSYNDIGPITVNADEANFLNDLKQNSDGIKKAKGGQVIDLAQYREMLIKKAA